MCREKKRGADLPDGSDHLLRVLICLLLRKEVIQPHLPIRLPCYDLAPIKDLALGAGLR